MWLVLDTHTVWYQSAVSPHWLVVIAIPLGETPLAADVNLKQSFAITIKHYSITQSCTMYNKNSAITVRSADRKLLQKTVISTAKWQQIFEPE